MAQPVTLPNVNEPVTTASGAMSPTWYRAIRSISGQALGGTLTETGVAAVYQATPADPAGTMLQNPVMMGLGGSITPAVSGRVQITLSGNSSNTIEGDGGIVQLAYGTGAAPANGAGFVGTAVGGSVPFTAARANQKIPFTLTALVMGLSVNGTAYWLDASLQVVIGGLATIENLSLSAIEV